MNVILITERPKEVQLKLNNLMYDLRPDKQLFFVVGFEGDTEASMEEFISLDAQRSFNKHVIMVADNISHLWQGSRQLLDIVMETRNEEAEEWFTHLLKGK